MNEYLVLFPTTDGVVSTPLNHEDLMDVLEYSSPDCWRQEMTWQNFQSTEENIKSFVEYCTQFEWYDKFNKLNAKWDREYLIICFSVTAFPFASTIFSPCSSFF